LKISIITVTFNSDKFLEETILSVKNQNYKNIEYILIDGDSKDNTINIIKKYSNFINIFITEKDNGIYDAMNKGLLLATGDIIGFLNSDDIYFDNNVLSNIVNNFTSNIECIYGNIVYVDNKNTNNIKRKYFSKYFKPKYFQYGFMPAHPSFYAKKELYNKVGLFKLGYKISADFDFLLRALLVHKAIYKFVDMTFVRMRNGGVSTELKNKILLNHEIYVSCFENNIKTNKFKIYLKYIIKLISKFISLL
jgi:glycosyltransferase involved in cell wall biosynthesis